MTYTHLLQEENVLLDLEATDADSALEALTDALVRADESLAERRDELLAALREREAMGSTASHRVAIPHVKLAGVEKVSVVVAVHKAGLDFRALDGEPVHVFFSVVRPEERAEEHLAVLRWIADIAQHQDFVPFACQAKTPRQIIELLSELSPAP